MALEATMIWYSHFGYK